MEHFEPPAGFRDWLRKRHLTERVVGDTVSRLRRLSTFLDISDLKSEPDLRAKLIHSREYAALSTSVKSQLKRAGSLFLEYRGERTR